MCPSFCHHRGLLFELVSSVVLIQNVDYYWNKIRASPRWKTTSSTIFLFYSIYHHYVFITIYSTIAITVFAIYLYSS